MDRAEHMLSYDAAPAPVLRQTAWDHQQQALIRSVAHQIRSTLTPVSISAEALATDPDSTAHMVRRHC